MLNFGGVFFTFPIQDGDAIFPLVILACQMVKNDRFFKQLSCYWFQNEPFFALAFEVKPKNCVPRPSESPDFFYLRGKSSQTYLTYPDISKIEG